MQTSDAHQLDLDALNQYLQKCCPQIGNISSWEKFKGGQSNPTFKVTSSTGTYVLRKQPSGKLLKSAHAVDREYRVLHALQQTDVPVAKVYHLCTDIDVLGCMFYIMEYVEGRIFWDSSLPDFTPFERRALYLNMAQVLASLHDVKVEQVGLSDYGRPGNYFERQMARWSKQYVASQTHVIQPMDELMKWLEQHMVADDGQVGLVHGDYRLDNLMIHPSKPNVSAVLDWELSTLGHPMADLAYQCMQMRLPSNIGHATGLGGVNRDALGIPQERDYIETYCSLRRLSNIEHWPFYLAFSFFRLGAIAQGVAKRALDGNASSEQAAQVGAMVEPLAQLACELIASE